MKKYFEILRNCSLFDNITDENLLPLLSCLNAKVLSFKKGETIISEGEPARNVGIVLYGAVQIIRVDYYGNRNIIANLDASHLFGESFACADIQAIPVSVVASENTEIMMIDCQRITKTCSDSVNFTIRLFLICLKLWL